VRLFGHALRQTYSSNMKPMQRKTVKADKTSAPMMMTATKAMKTAPAPHVPTHDEVAKRAYELYLARGQAPGHEAEDWLTAESQLGK
jgi:Protein of unknown function (DUF2934)